MCYIMYVIIFLSVVNVILKIHGPGVEAKDVNCCILMCYVCVDFYLQLEIGSGLRAFTGHE